MTRQRIICDTADANPILEIGRCRLLAKDSVKGNTWMIEAVTDVREENNERQD